MVNREFENDPTLNLKAIKDAAIRSIRRANVEFTTLCAKALKARGFDVQQEEGFIKGNAKAEQIVRRAALSPEGIALRSALSGVVAEPAIEACRWDEETKSRVGALYFQQHAFFQAQKETRQFSLPGEHLHVERVVDTFKGLSQIILGDLEPLTPNDIGLLVEQIVDRELANEGRKI